MNINFSHKRSVKDIQSSKSMLFSLILPNPIDLREEFYNSAETFPFPSVILTKSASSTLKVSIFVALQAKSWQIFCPSGKNSSRFPWKQETLTATLCAQLGSLFTPGISCHTSCRAFILCVFAGHFWSIWLKKVSSHIPQAKGFSPVCILLITFTECSLTHPSGKCLFSLVYLIVMFQNVSLHITSYRQRASLLCVSSPVSSHILHTNCFSAVCIFSWHFKMSRHTSRRQMDFLLCVSSHDVSEFPPPKVTSFMDSQSGVWLYP